MNKQELLEKLLETGSVRVWSNAKWEVGLEFWDNGSIHAYITDGWTYANGIKYDTDSIEGSFAWDWIPFPKYVRDRANSNKMKWLYIQAYNTNLRAWRENKLGTRGEKLC